MTYYPVVINLSKLQWFLKIVEGHQSDRLPIFGHAEFAEFGMLNLIFYRFAKSC